MTKTNTPQKCCPFLACCVLQFFLLTIYKPLLYNIDELQKWWSRYLISVQCTRAVCLFRRYSVISVKCINVCAGQIYSMTYYQSVYRYSCFAKAVQTQQIQIKKRVVQSNPNVSHFIDSIHNGQTQRENWKWLLTTSR